MRAKRWAKASAAGRRLAWRSLPTGPPAPPVRQISLWRLEKRRVDEEMRAITRQLEEDPNADVAALLKRKQELLLVRQEMNRSRTRH